VADAGWYNDESDPALARWHDGAGWTEHVVDKAEWLAIGHEPPPPDELYAPPDAYAPPDLYLPEEPFPYDEEEPYVEDRSRRIWAVVGSVAAVALLVVGGAAFGSDGSDDPPRNARSTGESDSPDRLDDDSDFDDIPTAGDLSDADLDGADVSGPDTDAAGGAGSSTTRRNGSAGTSTPAGGVRRTETSTRSQSNTEPITSGEVTSGDETHIGNKSETTNTTHLNMTGTTATTTTAAPPAEETTTTSTEVDPE
jgi:hypothetical protein